MMKPSVLSAGIGIGVLMLGGSGIAIPTLWSRVTRVENDRDKLESALQEVRDAKKAGDVASTAAKQQLAELQKQVEADRETLAVARESKRVLTNQLAEIQSQNRDLTAASGTLELRDQEIAALVQQLEQLRSDHESLLAQRDAAAPTATREASRPTADTVAIDGLVPVPPLGTVPPLGSVPPRNAAAPRKETSAKPQTTAKPPAAKPLRFDDRGWKTVGSRTFH